MLYYIILYCIIYYIVYILFYCTIYFILLYYIILYFILLYYIIFYYIILYYGILFLSNYISLFNVYIISYIYSFFGRVGPALWFMLNKWRMLLHLEFANPLVHPPALDHQKHNVFSAEMPSLESLGIPQLVPDDIQTWKHQNSWKIHGTVLPVPHLFDCSDAQLWSLRC